MPSTCETVEWMILLSYGFMGSKVLLLPVRATWLAIFFARAAKVCSRFSRYPALSMVCLLYTSGKGEIPCGEGKRAVSPLFPFLQDTPFQKAWQGGIYTGGKGTDRTLLPKVLL